MCIESKSNGGNKLATHVPSNHIAARHGNERRMNRPESGQRPERLKAQNRVSWSRVVEVANTHISLYSNGSEYI